MKNKNLVSIILPVHNGEAFLDYAIKSILNQTYSNFELIIVNDCSTDNSLNIINLFAEKDERIVVINNEANKKLPASLNIGHKKALGNYITWTSDDNILKSNFLENLINTILEKQVDVVYSNYDVINDNGDLIRNHKTGPTEHILFGNKIGAAFIYKKEVFNELNGYDESLFLLEDYDFWLRACAKFKVLYLDDNLYQYRVHSDSLTSNIKLSNEIKTNHNDGVIRMFKKFEKEFYWKPETLNLLINNFLNNHKNIIELLKNKNAIQLDLLKFNSINFNKAEVISGLKSVFRNQLVSNNYNRNFKTLIHVLKNEKELLFHPSFSNKTTFTYILKSLFH